MSISRGGSTSLDLAPLLDANNSDDSDNEGKSNGALLNVPNSGSKELRASHRDREREREEADSAIFLKKVGSAVFYGISSFMITVVNKTVLTSYAFPSFLFLSLGQLTASIVVLGLGKRTKLVSFPPLQRNTFAKIFPLPLIFGFNMIFGLGGTKALSLPMFAALRRFSILMTMLLELKILGVRPTTAVQISVYAMIGGALIAASDDLSFNMQGYTYVMITNALTASNGVYVKKN